MFNVFIKYVNDMKKLKKALFLSLFMVISVQMIAQIDLMIKPTFSIESRVTNLLQGGYEVGLFFNTKKNFSFGVQFAAQNVQGRAKEILFNSSNHDNLTIRLPWLIAAKARYHFRDHKEGIYAEISAGIEQFRVTANGETHRNNNGFILPSIGYLWHPWGREGFYLNPNIGYIYAFSRQPERNINGTIYELRPFFPSPAVSVGWKFK